MCSSDLDGSGVGGSDGACVGDGGRGDGGAGAAVVGIGGGAGGRVGGGGVVDGLVV